jgi:hypothetical protein
MQQQSPHLTQSKMPTPTGLPEIEASDERTPANFPQILATASLFFYSQLLE